MKPQQSHHDSDGQATGGMLVPQPQKPAFDADRLIRAGLADARRNRFAVSSSDAAPEAAADIRATELHDALLLQGYRVTGAARRGGQSVVYEAIQISTGRTVAIKVVRSPGEFDPVGARRFEYEADVLTTLRHLNIVSVYDAGVCGDRRYLVMDFVDGRPIDQYVAARGLAVRDLLSLFARVCDAVNAAHLKGVIHRDLKPANILMRENGPGAGPDEPIVLDFGLAKREGNSSQSTAVSGTPESCLFSVAGWRPEDEDADDVFETDNSSSNRCTSTGQFVGSLPWASPEQAAGDNSKIDIRTDVYSLGVILYQLLTGRFPYDVTGSMAEVRERIITSQPRPLGRAASTERASRFAGAIGNDEIEAIVMKCLAKAPSRRYESAGGLMADIRRFLAAEAIEARRDSTLYVLRKTLARHRVPVVVAAAFMLLTLGSAFLSTAFWQRAEREAERARQERDKSEQFARFMEDTLRGIHPSSSGLDTTLLKNMVDRTSRKIRAGELNGTEAELRLRLVIGRVYQEIAQLGSAHEMLDSIEALASLHYAPDSPEMAHVVGELASLHHFEGRFADSLSGRQNQLAILKRAYDNRDHEEIARVEFIIVECLRVLGRYEEALTVARAGLDVCQRLGLDNHPVTFSGTTQMAFALQNAGQIEEALSKYEYLLPRLREYYPGDDVRTAWVLTGMGMCRMYLGRPDEAVLTLQEAVDVTQRLYMSGPHLQKTRPVWALAEALRRTGRFAEAVECARSVIDTHAAHPEWDDGPRINAEAILARALYAAWQRDDAIASLRRFVAFAGAQPRPLTQVISLHLLGAMLLTEGSANAPEVELLMRKCLAVADSSPSDGIPAWMRWSAASMLGESLTMQSRFAEAEELLLRSYDELKADPHVPRPLIYDVDFKRDALRRIVDLHARWHEAEPGAQRSEQATARQSKVSDTDRSPPPD